MTRAPSSDCESKRPLPPAPKSVLAERDPAFDSTFPPQDEEFQNLFPRKGEAFEDAFPGDENDISDVRF